MLQHSNPAKETFGQCLDWHLERGTRPDGTTAAKGVPWGNKDFAKAVGARSSEGVKNERTIRNWRNGDTRPSPTDFHAILLVLFGSNADYAGWKSELTDKYHTDRGVLPDSAPPALTRQVTRPTKPLRCLGRDDDLKPVVDGLTATSDAIAVLVLGGPGMGKTTLTRQAANEPAVVALYGERRWFVELETATDATTAETAVVTALGLDPAKAKIDDALSILAEVSGLLILDNLETPFEGTPQAIEDLLSRLHQVPRLALLASIRGNEPPHGLRWSRQRTMNPLYDPFDRELFLDIASDIKPDDPHLTRLLAELGGVPLAIELVAHQAASHDTLAAVYDQWQKVGVGLAQRRGIAPSRLTALDRSLELSIQSPRLGDAGRRLFGLLGISPAGLCGEDIKALLGDNAFAARQGLLDCGLSIERDGRLDLLPPVRDFARRSHEPPDSELQSWRHNFMALAEQGTQIGGPDGAMALKRLMPEIPNVDSALRALLMGTDFEDLRVAVAGVAKAMAWSGLGTPRILREFAATCHSSDDIFGEATCLKSLGDIALRRSDYNAAGEAYEDALALYRKIDSILGEANCIQSLGDMALLRSDHDTARSAYEEALSLYREIADILGEANCIRSLGDIAFYRYDHDAARRAYEEALPLFRKVRDILGEANCIANLGNVALRRSDYNAAREAYEDALTLFRKVGDILGEANCIRRLGDMAFVRSDEDAARRAYEEALPLYRKVGSILGEANCIRGLGNIAQKYSDHETARQHYTLALGLYERIPEPHSIGWTYFARATASQTDQQDNDLAAARQAWLSIGRSDLVEKYIDPIAGLSKSGPKVSKTPTSSASSPRNRRSAPRSRPASRSR
ncbi:MAG: tetratricopeptide repeat protein [Proteobacteria bacterium]|nr:tetratricopeptide repeat protein [Pseudomonadota bacterium]